MRPDQIQATGSATYCPEDNKLRLYVGRVPREEFLLLRAEGWTCTPKQDCNFVAHWTPARRDTALAYGDGYIGDEDQSPADRAADRAERFGDYRDKRTDEATGHANRYDAGPAAHGFQNQARAERAAARHDRIADRAGDAWSKAEYWQRRTAGVISHALHVSTPSVRMGRIKDLEADIRRCEKQRAEYVADRERWQNIAALTDAGEQQKRAEMAAGMERGGFTYQHPRQAKEDSLWSLLHADRCNGDPITGAEAAALYLAKFGELAEEGEWLTHFRLRLAYENQMLEAQGGRAAYVEMIPGGWIGSKQIQKVNKSSATGRVVSVTVLAPTGANFDRHGKEYGKDNPRPLTLHVLNVERLPADSYREPTAEELAAFQGARKAAKGAAPTKPECPLINPTDADAERLQAIWNERAKIEHCTRFLKTYGKDYAAEFKPATVTRVKQETYSRVSKGAFARAETRTLHADAELAERASNMWSRETEDRKKRIGPALCMIRNTSGGDGQCTPRSVIILTDKPQKVLPAAVWEQAAAPAPAFALESETANA